MRSQWTTTGLSSSTCKEEAKLSQTADLLPGCVCYWVMDDFRSWRPISHHQWHKQQQPFGRMFSRDCVLSGAGAGDEVDQHLMLRCVNSRPMVRFEDEADFQNWAAGSAK